MNPSYLVRERGSDDLFVRRYLGAITEWPRLGWLGRIVNRWHAWKDGE